MKPYDVRVIIGRFQPVHKQHINSLIIPAALEGDLVIVLLGSSFSPRTFKNPLDHQLRSALIDASISDWCEENSVDKTKLSEIIFVPIRDYLYSDNQWIVQVQHEVNKAVNSYFKASVDYRVTLHGSKKDASSYYLDLFPQWDKKITEFIKTDNIEEIFSSATDIRNKMFLGDDNWEKNIYPSARKLLKNWIGSEQFESLSKEYLFIQKYKKSWESAPYPVIFHTVDNVVVYSGNVLLIKRKAYPGKGLWALPGGFVNYSETLQKSAVRECLEETKLRLKPEWLVAEEIFDAPQRSLRGRTITTGFLWKIPDRFKIDQVKGGDDADKARWFPISTVLDDMQDKLFEDHYDIITQLLKHL